MERYGKYMIEAYKYAFSQVDQALHQEIGGSFRRIPLYGGKGPLEDFVLGVNEFPRIVPREAEIAFLSLMVKNLCGLAKFHVADKSFTSIADFLKQLEKYDHYSKNRATRKSLTRELREIRVRRH